MRNYTVQDIKENLEKILIVENGLIIDQCDNGMVIAPTNTTHLAETLDTMDIIYDCIGGLFVIFYEDTLSQI